jgi:hypothetical protein
LDNNKFFMTSEKEFEKWKKLNWPVKLLKENKNLAQLLYENSILYSVNFYGHKWQYNENNELEFLYHENGESYFRTILSLFNEMIIIKTPTWSVISNFIYTNKGFLKKHIFEWKELEPCFSYSDELPYAYFDLGKPFF